MKKLTLLVFLSAAATFAIGYQHGTFASQSTQGVQWNGTASIIAESYTISVMPSYLDIVLDWEFDCKGGQAPDSFQNALEIVGNLNLVQDAAVTGMLLWNGDEILKAKLKPVQLAREEYEKVVDRHAQTAPRPRDPVIFEYGWGKDNYDISIFPVTWKGSRKLRMRYVVAAINMNGRAEIPFPSAFNAGVASYQLTAGPGMSSFEIVYSSGDSQSVASTAKFTANNASYKNIAMIRPKVENTMGKSVFYTAPVNLDNLKGSIVHVVGRTGAQVLATATLREDFVILWRWNHPEFFNYYAKQIVRQAETLKQFLVRLSGSDKRAAIVVDIPGVSKTVFDLGGQGSASYQRMLSFVDSLSTIGYSDDQQPFDPGFSSHEIDSMVALAQVEFDCSIRLAMSLFDNNERTIQRIVLLTAGPRWIMKTNPQFTFQADSSVEITTFASFAGTDLIIPPEAKDFYWPGISAGSILRPASAFGIEAVLTNDSGKTFTMPVTSSTLQQKYSWNFRSSHLDCKLHTTGTLKPQITWRIIHNGVAVGEITEEPAVVAMTDVIQFGSALAGTERLVSVDGTLPASLASTMGFVDSKYALLALENDVMDPLDQERFRVSGVPPLTNADIFKEPDESVPPEKNTDAPATFVTGKQPTIKSLRTAPVISMNKSVLTITFDNSTVSEHRFAVIGVYTLSGRVLAFIRDEEIINGKVRVVLPEAIGRSQQALIVAIKIGGMTFTRTIAIH